MDGDVWHGGDPGGISSIAWYSRTARSKHGAPLGQPPTPQTNSYNRSTHLLICPKHSPAWKTAKKHEPSYSTHLQSPLAQKGTKIEQSATNFLVAVVWAQNHFGNGVHSWLCSQQGSGFIRDVTDRTQASCMQSKSPSCLCPLLSVKNIYIIKIESNNHYFFRFFFIDLSSQVCHTLSGQMLFHTFICAEYSTMPITQFPNQQPITTMTKSSLKSNFLLPIPLPLW